MNFNYFCSMYTFCVINSQNSPNLQIYVFNYYISPSFVEASSLAHTMQNAHVVAVDMKTFLFSFHSLCVTQRPGKKEKKRKEMKIFHHNNREMMGKFVPWSESEAAERADKFVFFRTLWAFYHSRCSSPFQQHNEIISWRHRSTFTIKKASNLRTISRSGEI